MAFRAAIFDMDGLLIDSERAIMRAWIAGARELGLLIDESGFVQCIGRAQPESDAILVGLLGSRATFEATRERARALLHEQAAADDRLHEGAPLFPLKDGALALLGALRDAGVPCAVASSSSVAEIHHRLGGIGALPFFAAVCGGDEVPRGKPDPALYLLAAARLATPAQECIAFEDSDNGARAARAAGVSVVVVPDLRPPAEDVVAGSHRVMDRLGDALEHVPHWFARP